MTERTLAADAPGPSVATVADAGSRSPLPLSCYIRTLNEEAWIGAVVRAARHIADDVIVVDSGSTDRTVEAATAAGATVVPQPWLGNGHQKRKGEDHCRHDWLLDLDADEILSDTLIAEIRALFAGGTPANPVYAVPLVMVPPDGQPWYRFGRAWRNKLYDRRVLRMPAHKAWDQLELPNGIKAQRLQNPLLHHWYRGFEHMMAKLNRVSSVRAREVKRKSRPYLLLRIWAGFPVYFFKKYIQQGYILGGTFGFTSAVAIAYARWMRDVKMWEMKDRP